MKQLLLLVAALGALCLGPSCSSDSDPAGPTENSVDIDAYVRALPSWDTVSPLLVEPGVMADEATGPAEIDFTYGPEGNFACDSAPRAIEATPTQLTTFAPGIEALYVGALIQGGTYLGGMETMQELSIRQRAPLALTVDLWTEENSTTVANPDKQTVSAAVGAVIQAASDAGHIAGRNMSWNWSESYSLEQSLLHLGFSAKYGLAAVSADISYSQTEEQHTIAAFFKDEMFAVEMVHPQAPSDLFSSAFTQERLDQEIASGTIGPDNPPVYVSRIVYGRILVMTMTSTYSATEMKAALEASYANIDGDIGVENRAILSSSTISIHTVGGSAQAAQGAIGTGDLGAYFVVDDPLTTAKPLSYTLRTLVGDHVAYVSETNVYDAVECEEIVVDWYGNNFDGWRNAVLGLQGDIWYQPITADELVDADEVAAPPGNNVGVSSTLTFPGASTGLPVDFALRCIQDPSNGFTFNDQEKYWSGEHPSLSVGDVDDYQNDDFEVRTIAGLGGDTVYAVGIWIGGNDAAGGEYLKVYGQDDYLLAEFSNNSPGFPNCQECWVFVGVVSGMPITRILFNESSDGDDIFIKDPYFGVIGSASASAI